MDAKADSNENGSSIRVFLSYSRKDLSTAEHLRDRLIADGFGAYLDTHDILPGEAWQERLASLIEAADTVVFLVSPDAVASEICDWEVTEAERLGKRILPIVIRDAAPHSVPDRLKRLNYLFMRSQAEEAIGFATLRQALLTDIAWIREHTRLGGLAADWDRGSRASELMLRGAALAAAELWISQLHGGVQAPTTLHREFITASREGEQARAEAERAQLARTRRFQRRSAWALAVVALLVIAGLAAGISQARQTSLREARVLTSIAQRAIDEGRYDRAMRITVYGLPPSGALPFVSPWSEALEVKLAGAAGVSRERCRLTVPGVSVSNGAWVTLSRDGRRAAAGGAEEPVRIYDLETCRLMSVLKDIKDGNRTVTYSGGNNSIRFDDRGEQIFLGAVAVDVKTGQSTNLDNRVPTYTETFSRLPISNSNGRHWLISDHQRDRLLVVDIGNSQLDKPAPGFRFDALQRNSPEVTIASTLPAAPDKFTEAWIVEHGHSVVAVTTRAEIVEFETTTGREIRRRSIVALSDDQVVARAKLSQHSRLLLTLSRKVEVGIEHFVDLVVDLETGREVARAEGQKPFGWQEFSEDGHWVARREIPTDSLGEFRSVSVWHLSTGELAFKLDNSTSEFVAMALSPGGESLVTLAADGRLVLWANNHPQNSWIVRGLPQREPPNNNVRVNDALFATNGARLLIAGQFVEYVGAPIQEFVRIWLGDQSGRTLDLKSGSFLRTLTMNRSGTLVGTDAHIVAIDNTGATPKIVTTHTAHVLANWLNDGNQAMIAVAAKEGNEMTVIVRKAANGDEINRFRPTAAENLLASFRPDGQQLAVITAQPSPQPALLSLWDIHNGSRVGRVLPIYDYLPVFSPDSRSIAIAPPDFSAIQVRSTADLGLRATIARQDQRQSPVAFDSQGRRLITRSTRGFAIWDVMTEEPLIALSVRNGAQPAGLVAAQFSDDGATVNTFWDDNKIRTYHFSWPLVVKGSELRDRVCAERLRGAAIFDAADTDDPILAGLAGVDVCRRTGPLALQYWVDLARNLWLTRRERS